MDNREDEREKEHTRREPLDVYVQQAIDKLDHLATLCAEGAQLRRDYLTVTHGHDFSVNAGNSIESGESSGES